MILDYYVLFIYIYLTFIVGDGDGAEILTCNIVNQACTQAKEKKVILNYWYEKSYPGFHIESRALCD